MGSAFVVESKGHCFLCLSRIKSNKYSPVKQHPEPSEHVSVHSLSRYLNLDMKKVFIDGELIPRHLVEEVEKARLKVELCQRCTGLIGKFSRLSRLLEKIEIEMLSSIELIHQTLVKAEKEAKPHELRNQGNETDGWVDKLRILDVIRDDAIQQCSRKLRTSLPRVKTLNMTTVNITKEKAKFKHKRLLPKIEHSDSVANPSRTSSRFEVAKIETSMSNDENDDDGEVNYGQDDWDMQDESFTNEGDASRPTEDLSASNDTTNEQLGMGARPTDDNRHEFCEEVIPSGLPSDDIPQSLPDPITGKHKCAICLKEFAKASISRVHYKNVHLKIKYKCKFCEKIFTRKDTCLSHYRGVHMGVAFKCGSCGKIIADKSNLRRHLKKCGTETG